MVIVQIGSKRLKVQHKRMGGDMEGSGSGVRMGGGGGAPEYSVDPRVPLSLHHHHHHPGGAVYGGAHMDNGAPMKVMYYHTSPAQQQQRTVQPGTLAYHVGLGQL
jgi:hypothetical protein